MLIKRRSQAQQRSYVMSVQIPISCVVMEYHNCPFKVKEGKVFSVSNKRGELREEWGENGGNWGQLGHLQADLVTPLYPHQVDISA